MKKIIFSIIAVLIVIGGGVIGFGLFPVATVDGSVILYRDVQTISHALDTYKEIVQTREQTFLSDTEVSQLSLLNELILNKVIENGSKEFSADNIEGEVAKNLQEAIDSTEHDQLQEAARVLYGLSYDEFIEIILKSEAREVVVRDKVEKSGRDYAEWLKEKASSSNINIYFLPYEWVDGELVAG